MISTDNMSTVSAMMLPSKEIKVSATFKAFCRGLGLPDWSFNDAELFCPFDIVRHCGEFKFPDLSFPFLVDELNSDD
jgi:hypothetical protein